MNNFREKSSKSRGSTRRRKSKSKRPDKNSIAYKILIGLYSYQTATGRKYASKKDIKNSLKDLVDTLGELEIKSWAPIATLIKNELILPFTFGEEEKYSLSLDGHELAVEFYEERL